VTANLVKQELRVDSRYIHPLPLNEIYPIPNSNVEIVLIDANHCPGSVLILFIIKDKGRRHLHTGDFRAQPKMCLNQFICQPKNPPINCLYLDTTYLNPQYSFPAQEECIQAVCDIVLKELDVGSKSSSLLDNWMIKLKKDDLMLTNTPQDKVLIVVGTYTIGKERVFINIAKMLKCKIFAPTKKNKILLCQEDDELKAMITNNPLEAQIHVVSLRDIKSDLMVNYLSQYKSHFTSLIAFKPTGWTYKSTITETKDMKLAPLSHVIIPPIDRSLKLTPYYDKHCVKLFGVPYSEHSSFRELASFIASLDIKQIIPTVNMNRLNEMNQYFDKWNQDKSSKRIEVVTYPNEDHW
jgi:DNA cross-link repair 1A protein